MAPEMPVADAADLGAEEEEELEDLPQEEKNADPFNGVSISRVIDGTLYKGKVEDIEQGKVSKDRLYRVRYEDGDLEHFTPEQVKMYWNKIGDANMGAGGEDGEADEDEEEEAEEASVSKKPSAGDAVAKKPAAAVEKADEDGEEGQEDDEDDEGEEAEEEEAEEDEEQEEEEPVNKKPAAAGGVQKSIAKGSAKAAAKGKAKAKAKAVLKKPAKR